MTDSLWDDRNWGLALKADDPHELYGKFRSALVAAKETPAVDELPKEQQDWLRAT